MFMTIKEQLKCSAYILRTHVQLFVLHCTTTGRKLSLSRGCVDVFSNFTKMWRVLQGGQNVEGLTGWTGAPVEDPPDLKNGWRDSKPGLCR